MCTLRAKRKRKKPGIKEAVEQEAFTKLAYGKQGFYGYFREEKTQSVVSSGAGYFQMPMRIGSNSEIVVLHVQGK